MGEAKTDRAAGSSKEDKMKIKYEEDEEVKSLALWLIDFGTHLLSHSNLVEDAEITYEPKEDLLPSPTSYENACRISFSVTKRKG